MIWQDTMIDGRCIWCGAPPASGPEIDPACIGEPTCECEIVHKPECRNPSCHGCREVYWVTLCGDTIAVIKATIGSDPADLDASDNYAGPFVSYDHARRFAADWADMLVSP